MRKGMGSDEMKWLLILFFGPFAEASWQYIDAYDTQPACMQAGRTMADDKNVEWAGAMGTSHGSGGAFAVYRAFLACVPGYKDESEYLPAFDGRSDL